MAPVAFERIIDLPTLVGPISVALPAPSLGKEKGSGRPEVFEPDELSRSDINLESLARSCAFR